MAIEPSAHAPASAPPMSLAQQADWLLALWDRTFLAEDGSPAAGAMMLVTSEDAAVLHSIGSRMARMAQYEAEIRALVTGRSE